MKSRLILTIGLLTVIFLSACAPAASSTPVQPEATLQAPRQETEPPALLTSTPTETQPQPARTETLPAEAPAEVPQAVATSRGPDLEATDPTSVSLASGELQLVEFFRFT